MEISITGRVGSGQEVMEISFTGRVGNLSNGSSRVGSGGDGNLTGRVGSGQEVMEISRVEWGRVRTHPTVGDALFVFFGGEGGQTFL